jgi:hypothetical protein
LLAEGKGGKGGEGEPGDRGERGRGENGGQFHPQDNDPSPPKQPRVTASELAPVVEVTGPKIAQVALLNLPNAKALEGKVTLVVMAGANSPLVLVNESGVAADLKAGLTLAGFGAGSFVHKPRGPDGASQAVDRDRAVLFTLTNSEEEVLHGNQLARVGDLVFTERVKKPDATVCYHSLQLVTAAENPRSFTLLRQYDVYYMPKAAAPANPNPEGEGLQLGPKAQLSICAFLPLSRLMNLTHARVTWAVKWSAKGLSPIKPQLVLQTACVLPPGMALKL